MFSFRRSALLIALSISAGLGLHTTDLSAQASSSDSAQQPAAAPALQTSGALTVQARLKARREQRRVAAIHDVYSHLYEAYVGTGYLRFTPGDKLQRVNEYSWNVGVTRYFNENLGVTIDGRGTYGSAYIGPNQYTNTAVYKPAISQYTAMIGPTYRFVLQPKYSISGRVLAGGAFGNFSGDLGTFKPSGLGLYSDGGTFAVSASIPVEYNVSPQVGLRFAPEYLVAGFGSSIKGNIGGTLGLVIRWGKQ